MIFSGTGGLTGPVALTPIILPDLVDECQLQVLAALSI